MAKLLPLLEVGAKDAAYSVIWLHGLGADGHDFEPIVDELKLNKAIRFIFPHAPEMAVTINNGMRMPAWYDIAAMKIDQNQDELGIRQSEQSIRDLIENEEKRGIKSENIILAGFSQGGAIALHTGLRYDKPLAGIMALSTYLPLAETVENEVQQANKNIPIFLAHGSYDQIVPVELAEKTSQHLSRLGYSNELLTYPMEHSVCPDEIDAISNWINQCFT